MGQTKRHYAVYELGLSLEECAAHAGGERKLAGDIINLRRREYALQQGLSETLAKRFLWLFVEGLDENLMDRLADGFEENGTRFDKRRYCIPLARLQKVIPSFSVTRALDRTDAYQPFLTVDQDGSFSYLTAHRPLRIEGLIWDKQAGRFL